MAKEQKITVEGKVQKVNHDNYYVELPNKAIIIARVSGRMRMNTIRILAGDTVVVELSPYDLKRGIIIYRK
jgi:translation initiation factor IF-1